MPYDEYGLIFAGYEVCTITVIRNIVLAEVLKKDGGKSGSLGVEATSECDQVWCEGNYLPLCLRKYRPLIVYKRDTDESN